MKLNNDSRARIKVTVTTDADPATATLELKIDDDWHDCTWTAAATEAGGQWTRVAQTDYFAGPDATASGATVLALGRHLTETRVTWTGGDLIVSGSEPIDVE